MEKLTKHVEVNLALHKMEWNPKVTVRQSEVISIIEEDIRANQKGFPGANKKVSMCPVCTRTTRMPRSTTSTSMVATMGFVLRKYHADGYKCASWV